jgi:hypothetical protein
MPEGGEINVAVSDGWRAGAVKSKRSAAYPDKSRFGRMDLDIQETRILTCGSSTSVVLDCSNAVNPSKNNSLERLLIQFYRPPCRHPTSRFQERRIDTSWKANAYARIPSQVTSRDAQEQPSQETDRLGRASNDGSTQGTRRT